MDPFTAVGLAGNIITFLDFSIKLASSAKEIHASATGSTESDKSLRNVIRDVQQFAKSLEACNPITSPDPETETLNDLVSDCLDIAEDLLEVLEKVKAKDPASKRESAKVALKRLWKAKDIEDMQARLDTLSKALDRRFQEAFRKETREQIYRVIETGKSHTTNIEHLRKSVESVRQGVAVTSLNTRAIQQLREIIRLSDQAVLVMRQRLILEGLRFSGMEERYDQVVEAHAETLEWMFDLGNHSVEGYSSTERELRWSAARSFDKWLGKDGVIFHLLGKPGSGKSTLMKFLLNHNQTVSRLKDWANEKRLIVSSHFFWRPGSLMQKSAEGLVRSLIYSILQHVPELMPKIFPGQWAETESMISGPHSIRLDGSEIRKAFDLLMYSSEVFDQYRFALFIDGLDEFEPSGSQWSYLDLARSLKKWCAAQPNQIKMCLSSREYPVFEEEFSAYPKLRLQNLTTADICRVVNDYLDGSQYFQSILAAGSELQSLKTSIRERSDGVFLWVTLVLRNLEEGIINGDAYDNVRARLLSLPTELDDLFTRLLMSISKYDQAYCFPILRLLSETNGLFKITPLIFSCIDMTIEGRNPDATTWKEFTADKREGEIKSWVAIGSPRLLKRVHGRFVGILEAVHNHDTYEYLLNPFVRFTHRSVHDFLADKKTESALGNLFANFDWFSCLLNVVRSTTWILMRPDVSCFVARDIYARDHCVLFICQMVEDMASCGWKRLDSLPISLFTCLEEIDAILSSNVEASAKWDPESCPNCSIHGSGSRIRLVSHKIGYHYSKDICMANALVHEYFERMFAPVGASLHGTPFSTPISSLPTGILEFLGRNDLPYSEKTLRRGWAILNLFSQHGLGPNSMVGDETVFAAAFREVLAFAREFTPKNIQLVHLIDKLIEAGAETRVWFTPTPLEGSSLIPLEERRGSGCEIAWAFAGHEHDVFELHAWSQSKQEEKYHLFEKDHQGHQLRRARTLLDIIRSVDMKLSESSMKSVQASHEAIQADTYKYYGFYVPTDLGRRITYLTVFPKEVVDKPPSLSIRDGMTGRKRMQSKGQNDARP